MAKPRGYQFISYQYVKKKLDTLNASTGGTIAALKKERERYRKALIQVQAFLHTDALPIKERQYIDVVAVVDNALGVRGLDGVLVDIHGKPLDAWAAGQRKMK